jgi:hypothetical protein
MDCNTRTAGLAMGLALSRVHSMFSFDVHYNLHAMRWTIGSRMADETLDTGSEISLDTIVCSLDETLRLDSGLLEASGVA